MDHSRKQSIIKAFGPGEDCPALEEILTETVNEKIHTHLSTCAYCKSELALYREFNSEEVRPNEHDSVQKIVTRLTKNSPVERKVWWKSLLDIKILAPALVAVAMILTMWTPWQQRHRTGPDVSGDEYRSGKINIHPPDASNMQLGFSVLSWEAVPGATSYQVRVAEVDNTELWSANVTEAKAELPAKLRDQLKAPKVFQWRVSAQNAENAIIADSGWQRVSVAQ